MVMIENLSFPICHCVITSDHSFPEEKNGLSLLACRLGRAVPLATGKHRLQEKSKVKTKRSEVGS